MTTNGSSGEIIISVSEDIIDLVPRFMDNRRKDVESIHKALEVGDYETVRGLGHAIKGSGGTFGFDEATEIGIRIEDAAKARNADVIRQLTHELLEYFDRVRVISVPSEDI